MHPKKHDVPDFKNVMISNPHLQTMSETESFATSAGRGRGRRLLLVAPGIPHSVEGGSSVVYFEYIKALKRAGFTILNLLLLQPDNASDKRLEVYRDSLEEPGRFDILPCWSPLFVTSHRLRHRLDTAALDSVHDKITAFNPDFVLSLDILCGWAVADFPLGKKTIWLGDLNFETQWYGTLYARREGNRSLKFLFGTLLYAVLWAWIYRNVLKRFDRVVVCAKSSEKVLGRLGIKARYLPYPWPELSTKPRDTSRRSKTPCLLFFGGLGGLGSRSAFHLTMEKIYPLLQKEFGVGRFKIIVCGRGHLPNWAQHEIDKRPEIDFQGYIEDLDSVMDECHALLAPIDVPVGNRTRILTAISRRLLVIAHRNTALGNPDLIDGETCYLASEPQEFVAKICRAIRTPDEANQIVEEAYRSYRRNFDPARTTSAMMDEITGAISDGSCRV